MTTQPSGKQEEVKIPTKEEILSPQVKDEENEEIVGDVVTSPEETLAQTQGWVPKKEWKGNPDEWRPAKEFNERGELFARIKTQSKELQELKQAMSFLTTQQRKQYEAGFTEAITRLKANRDAALQEGDVVKAQQFNDKIDETKSKFIANQPAQVQQQITQEPSTTFKTWFEKNNWYTKDKVLTKYADAVGLTYREENPNGTEGDMLTYVSKELIKEFPQKFGVKETPKGPPSPDGEGRGSPRGRQGEGQNSQQRELESGMTEMQRGIMKTILKSTGMTKEQYLKQYASQV